MSKPQSELYIGVMSGTSLDGIDVVAVDFSAPQPKLVASLNETFPEELRELLHEIALDKALPISQVGYATTWLSQCYSDAINHMCEQNGLNKQTIKAIGCHGQTVQHHPQPPYPYSIQLNNPSLIAAQTHITTIGDFRSKDLAYGGQGAPLVPAFHHALFGQKEQTVVVLNIGGIANISILQADSPVSGYDTGPGNILLDSWINHCRQLAMDEDGQWAQSGTVLPKLLDALRQDDYFIKRPPKSTGREHFNLAWLLSHLSHHEKSEDVQATLLELTAMTITDQLPTNQPGELLVCGGGARNKALMQRLQARLPQWQVMNTDKRGVHSDYMEAMAFAWLARQCLKGIAINMPNISGASRSAILGGIFKADR
ncbi:anhydro-N-acetylmuramic acid kinase [Celerinatantimonas sp. MCCC 1A17872]|uniref:anhydro-N-acetylmuramic acid kinase n=1 Tax=Celerinatantimonas sp. MCCC 1A17872 TaxID=3177514 RepID=UPI0038C5129F